MPERIRICLLIPSLQAGGMERVMSELANFLAKKENLDVHFILYGSRRELFYPLDHNVIIHKPSFEFNDFWRLSSTFRTALFVRRTVKRIRPNAILSFGEYWNSFVLLCLFGLKFPVFVSDRCQPDKSLGFFHDWLRKWLYPGAKGIIAQTERAREIYDGQFKHSNIKVIPNPIRSISSETSELRENIVLSVGRLIMSKNFDQLIEMFVEVSEPDWKLVIIGDDALKQRNMSSLSNLIDRLNAKDRVILVGRQSNVESFYIRSKIFAFTSSSEGFPNVIGEAMAAGLPVIAYDCTAGPADMVIDGRNGYLVPLFDRDSFVAKLRTLMQHGSITRKFGDQAKEDSKRFALNRIGEEYFSFIINS